MPLIPILVNSGTPSTVKFLMLLVFTEPPVALVPPPHIIYYGYTPVIEKLARDDFHHITIELEGHEPSFITLKFESVSQ